MRFNGTQATGPSLTRWRAVEVDFHLLAVQSGKFLQDCYQFHFVIYGVQAQSYFWDQVVSVDKIGHVRHYNWGVQSLPTLVAKSGDFATK